MKAKAFKASISNKVAISTSDCLQLGVGISDVYFAGLEPRIALDAAAGAELMDEALGTADVEFEAAPSAPPVGQPASAADLVQMLEADVEAGSASDLSRQIVFVDASIDNFDEFMAGLPSDIEAHVISTERDGISQIASTLAGRSDIEAIHIVSHGDAGALILGDALVTAETIQGRYADEFAAIGASLTDSADLLIYGCDFAFGAKGELAANLLASATGADVAASTDITGSEIFGGDWVLEYETGEIEADALQLGEWEGKLNNTVVEVSLDGSYSFSADDFDGGRGGTISTITIVALPRDGALTLNGEAVVEGQQIAAADLGSLLYTPPADGDVNIDFRLYYSLDDDIGPNPSPPMAIVLDTYADYTVTNAGYFVDTRHLGHRLPVRVNYLRAVPDGSPVIFTDAGEERVVGEDVAHRHVRLAQVVVRYYSGEFGDPVDGLVVESQTNINTGHFASDSDSSFNDNRISGTTGGRLFVSDGSFKLTNGIYAEATNTEITRTINIPRDAAYFQTGIVGLSGHGQNIHVQIFGSRAGEERTLVHDQMIADDPMMDIKIDVSGYETLDLVYSTTDGTSDSYFGFNIPRFSAATSQIVTPAEEVAAIDTRLLREPPAGATWDSFELDFAPTNGVLQLGGADLVVGTSYQMSDLDNILFVPNAGTATGRDVELFSLVVTASDGSTMREVVSIDILSSQNVPRSTDISISLEHGTSQRFSASDFALEGLGGNSVDELIVDFLPSWGTLTLDGVAVATGQAIAVSDIENFAFEADEGAFGTPYNSFDVRVRDSAGTLSDTYTVTVDVYSRPEVNVPSIAVLAGETHEFAPQNFGFSDADGDAMGSIIIDVVPAQGGLRLNGVLVTAGQEIAVEDLVDLIFEAPSGGATGGYDSFSYRLGDENGYYSDVATVSIDIDAAPVTTDNTLFTQEDTDYAFSTSDFSFFDSNAEDSFAAVIIDSLPATGALSLNGAAVSANQEIPASDIASLVYSPAANENGFASFTFSVQDNTGRVSEASSTMTVDVTAVADAPKGMDNTISTAEDTDLSFSQGDFGFSDVDQGSTFAAVIIDSLPATGALSLNGAAVLASQEIPASDIASLVYIPAANGNGFASFTFSVQDNTGRVSEASSTMTVDVTAVADAPEGMDNTVSTAEDTGHSFSLADFQYSDIEGNEFASVIIDRLPTSGTLSLNGIAVTAGQEIAHADIEALSFISKDPTGSMPLSFTYRLRDDGGTSDGGIDTSNPYTMNIAVEPVYELSATFAANAVLEIDLTADLNFNAGDSLSRNVDPATEHIELRYLDDSGQRVLFEAGDTITVSQSKGLVISNSDASMTGEFTVGFEIDLAAGSRGYVYLSLDVTPARSDVLQPNEGVQSEAKQQSRAIDYSDKVSSLSEDVSLPRAGRDSLLSGFGSSQDIGELGELGISTDSDALFVPDVVETGSVGTRQIIDRAESDIHNMRVSLAVAEDKLVVEIDDLLDPFGEDGLAEDELIIEMLDGSAIPDWITITATGEVEIDPTESNEDSLVELRVTRKSDDTSQECVAVSVGLDGNSVENSFCSLSGAVGH